MPYANRVADAPVQKVVVVNGNTEVLGMLESVLDAGRYDMVFVEASAHAYSRIRHVQPDLVILCMRIDELEGFHLLSMLKLDPETKLIPLVTCTVTQEDEVTHDESLDPPDDVFSQPAALQLN